jgi:hypothetical protein
MGANRWWASVQPGQDDEGKRTSDDECKQIAHAIRAALSAAQEAPAGPTRQQIIDWLDALDIEVTDKQLAGLFDVVAMETTQDAPACLSKTSDYETQSTLPLTDAPQCRLAAQAVPQDVESLAINRYRPVPSGVIAYKVVAGDGERTLFFGTKNECQSVARRLTEAFLDGAHVMLAAAPAAPKPAAQQGEIAWSAIPATVRRDVTMLAGYAEGSKSAEIVNTVRRVIDWLNADRIAAQAQEAAPAVAQAATAPLLARIAELEAELEKTKAIFAASCNHAAAMEMDRDAKRWRAMRQTMIAVDFEPEMGGSPVVMFELHAKAVRAGPEGADEIADAAMKEQGYA